MRALDVRRRRCRRRARFYCDPDLGILQGQDELMTGHRSLNLGVVTFVSNPGARSQTNTAKPAVTVLVWKSTHSYEHGASTARPAVLLLYLRQLQLLFGLQFFIPFLSNKNAPLSLTVVLYQGHGANPSWWRVTP